MGCQASAALAAEDVYVDSHRQLPHDVRLSCDTSSSADSLEVPSFVNSAPDISELAAASAKAEAEIRRGLVSGDASYDWGEASVSTTRKRLNEDKWSKVDISAKLATKLPGAEVQPDEPVGAILSF